MASKLSSWSRDIYLCALLGVLVYVAFSTCFHGLENNLEEQKKGHLAKNSVQQQGIAARNISDGFTALAIQFLHFFLAKCLQFRYLPVLQPAPSMSMPFWLAYTQSISNQPS
ncbi:hypothetical protein QQP08_023239 [Theobroma cacao]|nr:hypothetical protein QQP08_023239 [Theobroma cacao]